MALYEYRCDSCGDRFDKRMPMSEVLQILPCPKCGKSAKKVLGGFALVGVAEPGIFDQEAPWDGGGDDMGGGHDHGHSHGPGGHSHGMEGMDLGGMDF
ncbi:MAG: FmdB family zinc ribbon protein [Tepidiformaceae bacterium]